MKQIVTLTLEVPEGWDIARFFTKMFARTKYLTLHDMKVEIH